MEAVISESMAGVLKDQGLEALRDPETGRFMPREVDDETPAPENAAETAPADAKGAKVAEGEPETPETPELPEGFVALPSADGQKLATKFTLLDKDGELETPGGLMVKATFNGREESLPLDQLVRRAQSGAWNQQREARINEVDSRNREMEQSVAQMQRDLQVREQQLEALLSDELYRQRAIEEYQQYQTPEARARRAEEAVLHERQSFEVRELGRQGQQYLNSEVAPAISAIVEALPSVSADELVFKMKQFVDRQIDPRLGIVPPARYVEINRFVTDELVPWAQHAHEARTGTAAAPATEKVKAAEDKAKRAEVAAQRAKRTGTAQFKPSVAAPPGQKAESNAPRSHTQLVDDAITSALSAMH